MDLISPCETSVSSLSMNQNKTDSPEKQINEKPSRRFYKQIYRKDWEDYPVFKGWLSSVPCDKYKAECTACRKELLAHRLTLLKHASSAKHLNKIRHNNQQGCAEILTPSNNGESFELSKAETPAESTPNDTTLPQLIAISEPTFHVDTSNGKSICIQLENQSGEFPTDIDHLPELTLNGNVHSGNLAVSTLPQTLTVDKTSNNGTTVSTGSLPENIGIIIRTDSFIDISDSSEAINIKQGYVAKNSLSDKTNTTILTCDASFLSDKIGGNVLNKLTTYPLQVSTRVVDFTRGTSVANLNITLYKLTSGKWLSVSESVTDEVGRCNLFPNTEPFFAIGCYKLHYDVAAYFELQNYKSYFPFIEISFLIRFPNETHHIPLMISPNGYTACRSSDF